MYQKLRNTLAGMTAGLLSVLCLALAAHTGVAPQAGDVSGTADSTRVLQIAEAGDDDAAAAAQTRPARSHGIRVQLAMPYFSFASILPRRGS